MHPSFGVEYSCRSTKWEEIMKGPSQAAVLAHTYKVLHYRTLFPANPAPHSALSEGDASELSCEAFGTITSIAEAA